MTLGDILKDAAVRDLSIENNDNKISYKEFIEDNKFCINFSCSKFPEASIDCSVPFTGKDEERNYLILYFLSMVYNAAIHGMKRMKHKKNKK